MAESKSDDSGSGFWFALLLLGAGSHWLTQQDQLIPMRTQANLGVIVFALIALVAFAGGLLELVQRHGRKERVVRWKNDTYWMTMGLGACFMISMAISGYMLLCATAAIRIYFWVQEPSTSRAFALTLCVPLAFIVGLIFFGLRLWVRGLYGLTEVAAGLLAAFVQVDHASSSSSPNVVFAVAFLTASIYLVVRGLDNMHQGMKAEKPDIVGRFLIRSLTRKKPPVKPDASPTSVVERSEAT